MDKDTTGASLEKSSDERVEMRGLTFEDLIRGDDEPVKNKKNDNSLGDPLSNKEETEGARKSDGTLNKIIKKTLSLPADTKTVTQVGPKSILVATTSNNNVVHSKVIPTTTSSGFVKIAPRSVAATTSSSSVTPSSSLNTPKKIIYLQRPGSAPVPVRVPTTVTTNASTIGAASKPIAIQLIRNPDGSLVPFKSSKGVNISNVSQLAGKKIITTTGAANGQMIKAPIKTISTSVMPAVSTTTTVSSLLSPTETAKPKMRPVIATKSVLPNTINGNTTGSGKMILQNTTAPKQVVLSQNFLKLSPNSSGGQLQAIQIPGKSGVQYVRVLNNTSGIAHKVGTSDAANTAKYTVVRQNKPPMKIMVKSPFNDKDRQKMMTTVPTLRKINEVVIKPHDTIEGRFVQTQKISQINSQIRQFGNPGESKNPTSNSKYIVVSKSLIRSTVTSQNQKIVQARQSIIDSKKDINPDSNSPPPAKKLYSVLRPNTDQKEVKLKTKAEPAPFKPSMLPNVSAPVRRLSRSSPSPEDATVTIRRKHCNCTKSQCLKLYCDCFANGEFCQDCNCKDCLNNLDNEDERQKAIRICLERNPNSFKPKITTATNESDQRLHNKGCNCKRSGCLKNYCECYEAKIPCSSNCKCVGCRNIEDHPDLDMDMKKCPAPAIQTLSRVKRSYDDMINSRSTALPATSPSVPASTPSAVASLSAMTACGQTAEKQPCNFITQEVVDATIQCLIAQADECKKSALTPHQTEKMVMEELGRCLVEIIDFSIRNTDQN